MDKNRTCVIDEMRSCELFIFLSFSWKVAFLFLAYHPSPFNCRATVVIRQLISVTGSNSLTMEKYRVHLLFVKMISRITVFVLWFQTVLLWSWSYNKWYRILTGLHFNANEDFWFKYEITPLHFKRVSHSQWTAILYFLATIKAQANALITTFRYDRCRTHEWITPIL